MEKLIEKLNSTGIKFLDLVDKGLDKLPDGISALWESVVIRTQLTGIAHLIFSIIGILISIYIWSKIVQFCKGGNWLKDIRGMYVIILSIPASLSTIFSLLTFLNIDNWFMAFYPEQYILSELMLYFIK